MATAENHSEPSGKFSSGTERTIARTDGPPTAYSTKDLLKEWMDSRGIRYADYAKKIELHELIKKNKPKFKTQYVDRMLAQHEHISLGLPPYYPELNATKHLGYYKKLDGCKDCDF